jgi:hypothetical protein
MFNRNTHIIRIPLHRSEHEPCAMNTNFAERVAYQQAIEDVYWHHRIWQKERPDAKPRLDAVMSQAQLEKKVCKTRRTTSRQQ